MWESICVTHTHTHTAPHVRVHCIKTSILGFYSASANVHSARGYPIFSKYPRPETAPLTPHWLAVSWRLSLPSAAWAASIKTDLATERGPSLGGFRAFPGRVSLAEFRGNERYWRTYAALKQSHWVLSYFHLVIFPWRKIFSTSKVNRCA